MVDNDRDGYCETCGERVGLDAAACRACKPPTDGEDIGERVDRALRSRHVRSPYYRSQARKWLDETRAHGRVKSGAQEPPRCDEPMLVRPQPWAVGKVGK